MNERTRLLGITTLIAALTSACSGSGGLRGADFEIPFYPEARVVEHDSGGFSAGEDFSSLDRFDYVSWTLKTRDPMDRVVDFYRSKYPREVAEALDDPDADDEVVVNFKAPGMGSEDYVELSIVPGEIGIMQITLRK